jgi:hypothetical protein
MYIILVGPPASKKGTAMKFGLNLLYKLGIALSPDSVTKEALIKRIRESSEPNTYRKNGKSIEVHHCSYTISSPEISVLLNNNDDQIIQYLTDWFDCGKTEEGIWTYDTKNGGTDCIKGIWINMIGGTTPEQLAMYPKILSTGLASRLILVYSPTKGKSIYFPELSKKQKELGKQLLKDLSIMNNMAGEFSFTENFKENYKIWYESNDKRKRTENRNLLQYYDRRPVHLLKLCMILCASRSCEMKIRKSDLEKANQILIETERKMPFAINSVGENPKSKIVARVLEDIVSHKKIKKMKLFRKNFSDFVSYQEFDLVLEALIEADFIHTTDTTVYYKQQKKD